MKHIPVSTMCWGTREGHSLHLGFSSAPSSAFIQMLHGDGCVAGLLLMAQPQCPTDAVAHHTVPHTCTSYDSLQHPTYSVVPHVLGLCNTPHSALHLRVPSCPHPQAPQSNQCPTALCSQPRQGGQHRGETPQCTSSASSPTFAKVLTSLNPAQTVSQHFERCPQATRLHQSALPSLGSILILPSTFCFPRQLQEGLHLPARSTSGNAS